MEKEILSEWMGINKEDRKNTTYYQRKKIEKQSAGLV